MLMMMKMMIDLRVLQSGWTTMLMVMLMVIFGCSVVVAVVVGVGGRQGGNDSEGIG